MGAVGAIFVAGVRRQATYRLALVSGMLTNVFFGIVRTALFLALYRERGRVGGLDEQDALTYVWILQAMFGAVWTPWLFELPDQIRSGDWVAELTRPGDPLARHFAFDLGRAAYFLALRAPIPLIGASIVLDLHLPVTVGGWSALGVSLVLGAAVAAEIRFLIGSLAFWTPDYRGVFALVFMPLWFLSGFLIPTDYFPGPLRTFAYASPLIAMLMAPVRVAIGQGSLAPIALQLVWLVVLALVCRAVLARALDRLVVFGG